MLTVTAAAPLILAPLILEKEEHKDDDQVWMEQNKISEEAMENVVRQDRLLRRDLEQGRQEFNLQQTANKEMLKKQLFAENEEEKMFDVMTQMQSPFLSESTPYVGKNGKILFTEYKGESDRRRSWPLHPHRIGSQRGSTK